MSDEERLTSISEASKQIGVHRSTLLRQVKKGCIRSHNGRVRLSEVQADRSANLYPGRCERWRGRPHDAAKSVASGAADATETAAYSCMRGALVKIVSRAEERIATTAVAAGASLAVAYTTSIIGRMELQAAADELLEDDDFIELKEDRDGPIKKPNWTMLAARAGEAVDLEAWEAYCAARPWWKE